MSESEYISRKEFDEFKKQMESNQSNQLSLLVFSGSLDKLIASFIIATGAAASGMDVTMFFTFWASSTLKKHHHVKLKKNLFEKLFGWFLPRGSVALPLSQMNMAGMGPKMIRHIMKKNNVASLEELMEAAGELGVKIRVCEMSMGLMGIKQEEIIEYPDISYCGVTSFLEDSSRGKMTLFI